MKKTTTERGFALIEFEDRNGVKCNIQESSIATEDCIWIGTQDADPKILNEGKGWERVEFPANTLFNTRMHLTIAQVEKIIPILQHFVETGYVDIPSNKPEP